MTDQDNSDTRSGKYSYCQSTTHTNLNMMQFLFSPKIFCYSYFSTGKKKGEQNFMISIPEHYKWTSILNPLPPPQNKIKKRIVDLSFQMEKFPLQNFILGQFLKCLK